MKNTEEGITLVAIIITIIIMLILVGVTVTTALNGGLFNVAKNAVGSTNKELAEEQKIASGMVHVGDKWYDSNKDYLNGIESIESLLIEYNSATKDENGILTENAKYTSNGKRAVIPKGFKVSEIVGEQTITGGLVIKDGAGNEYVWIPVEDGTLDTTYDNAGVYSENLPEDLVESIASCKGFYIARYEAGCMEPRHQRSKLTDTLSKKGLYPYNLISYTDAKTKAEEMYTNTNTYGVKATLQYRAEWAETLQFIKDTVDITNSVEWGNHYHAEFTFNGKYSINSGFTWEEATDKTKPKPKSTSYLLTTGASEKNKAKNIYDLAGNVSEWIIMPYETYNTVYTIGGSSYDPYDNIDTSSSTIPNSKSPLCGFRVALYAELDAE